MNILFQNRTANGASPTYDGHRVSEFRDTPLTVYILGTFGGAKVNIQASPDNATWVNIPDAEVTAEAMLNIDLAANKIRAFISSASGTTNISVFVG